MQLHQFKPTDETLSVLFANGKFVKMYDSVNEHANPGKEEGLQMMKLIDALLRSAEQC